LNNANPAKHFQFAKQIVSCKDVGVGGNKGACECIIVQRYRLSTIGSTQGSLSIGQRKGKPRPSLL